MVSLQVKGIQTSPVCIIIFLLEKKWRFLFLDLLVSFLVVEEYHLTFSLSEFLTSAFYSPTPSPPPSPLSLSLFSVRDQDGRFSEAAPNSQLLLILAFWFHCSLASCISFSNSSSDSEHLNSFVSLSLTMEVFFCKY